MSIMEKILSEKYQNQAKKDYFHSVLHLLNTPHFIKSDHLTKNIPGSRFKYVYRSWIMLFSISENVCFIHS